MRGEMQGNLMFLPDFSCLLQRGCAILRTGHGFRLNLSNINLEHANLQYAKFYGAFLQNANLQGTDLFGAYLKKQI